MKPKYPDIEVQLTGENGNAFFILGKVSRAMRRAGVKKTEIDAYMNAATTGDYNHLLKTTMEYVTVN